MLLSAIYEARSKIVHEGLGIMEKAILKIAGNVCPALHFVNFAEEIVRQILREYLSRLGQGKTVSEINRDLDTLIINSVAG